MHLRETHHRVAPVSKDGRPPISGCPRSASNVRKSGKPDLRCSRRRARDCGIRVGPKSRPPHHEAGRDRECIKLTGLRFWRNCAPRAQLAQGVADLMQGTAASLRSARTVETSLTVPKTVDESGDLLRCDLISKHDCNHSVLRSGRILIMGERSHRRGVDDY